MALAGCGKIILYSSHVLEVVEKVCTLVLILRSGQVVAHDSAERLRTLLASPSLENVLGFDIYRRRVAGELSLQYDERPVTGVQTLDLLR